MLVEFRMETRANNVLENTRSADWERELVTHYTGIGTEVRENYRDGSLQNARVVVNMPQGLGRYMPEDASAPVVPSTTLDENGKPTDWSVFNPKFEWYLKNHIGSTMLVYGTGDGAGSVKAAYDYRAFGERVDYTVPTDKITETFTGKELDDEIMLSNHGARMLDPMLGMWISVDPKRFFPSPYLYMGNGYNPIRFTDLNGKEPGDVYLFYPDRSVISMLIGAESPDIGFAHAAIESKTGMLFSATFAGVGSLPKDEVLNGRAGVIMRPKSQLDLDAMQNFIDNAEGGTYFIDDVCSGNVVKALKAGGLDLEEHPTVMDFIMSPKESLERYVPSPSHLSENPNLEKVGDFDNE